MRPALLMSSLIRICVLMSWIISAVWQSSWCSGKALTAASRTRLKMWSCKQHQQANTSSVLSLRLTWPALSTMLCTYTHTRCLVPLKSCKSARLLLPLLHQHKQQQQLSCESQSQTNDEATKWGRDHSSCRSLLHNNYLYLLSNLKK